MGKVLLEKLLFSLSAIQRIFVLVRPKTGSSAYERFQKEILDSQCFDRLKLKYPNFNDFIAEKVHPIAGDMLKEGLALSQEDAALLGS